MPDDLTVETFMPHVGSAFTAGELELTLTAAQPLGEPPPGLRAPFRLEFRGPVDPALAQQMHELTHPALGTLEIFLVPVGRDAAATSYEAIFG